MDNRKRKKERRNSKTMLLERIRFRWKCLWDDQGGMGVVEIILIIIVLIGLVLIFKDNLSDLVDSLFSTMTENAGEI